MVITTGASPDGARGPGPVHRDAGGERPRTVPGLFDLPVVVAPDGGLAVRERPDWSLTGAQLAGLVRDRGGAGYDVRVLVAAGPQIRPTIDAMARDLNRDVLVPPIGSELGYLPRPAPASARTSSWPGDRTDRRDIVPIDLVTGSPVDWLAVPPSGDASSGHCWFELAGGLVLEREGTVALPLPGGGLSLATRDDFVRRRSAAAAMRPGHPNVLTVAVGVHSGDFVVGQYDGRVRLCDGRTLAAVLARLPVYGGHLRLWLAWPDRLDERQRLEDNLARLAATTGATVWAPAVGGRVEILDGCRDLMVIRADARPGRWVRYGKATGEAPFQSDVDGRLVPVGGVVTASYPGVPLVSVPAAQENTRLPVYERLRASQSIFRADLAVLADGRFALRYRDDSLLAAGQRQTGQLLEIAGWHGRDLMLISAISPERAAGAWQHAEKLARYLRCSVTLSEVPRPQPAALPAAPDRSRTAGSSPTDRHSAGEPGQLTARSTPAPMALAATPSRPALPTRAPVPLARRPTRVELPAPAAALPVAATPAPRKLADAGADQLATARAIGSADAWQRAGLAEVQASSTRLSAEIAPAPVSAPPAAVARADRSVPERPVLERPVEEMPVREMSVTEKPVLDRPVVMKPVAELLVVSKPLVEQPTGVKLDPFAPLSVPQSRFIDGPRLTVAQRSTWHGITWLTPQPQVNQEECELFVECADDPQLAAVDGVPAPGLFLLAHLDGKRLGARTRSSHLLVLRVGPGAAVDVAASEVVPPPALVAALHEPDVYLLPAGWLDRCRLIRALRVARDGTLIPQQRFAEVAVNLLSRGAAHGVPGLPNEVQRWPQGRVHATAARFVMPRADDPEGLGRWQRLYRRRPAVVPGHRLLEVEIDRERAIDVAGTARGLAGLPQLRTNLAELAADGIEFLLPVASYRYTPIVREFSAERGGWRRVSSSRPRMLDTWPS